MNFNDYKQGSQSEIIQIVSFSIGDEEFGLDILNVQEINRVTSFTKIPESPDFVIGIVNLRGEIIPVIDMRTRLGIPSVPPDKDTRIIIVELDKTVIGFIVDKVNQVIRITRDAIEPPPQIMHLAKNKMVSAVVKLESRLLLLLDLDESLALNEKREIEQFTVNAESNAV